MRPKKPNIGIKCLGPRVMSALQVWLWLLIFIFQNEFRISYSTEPGYLDFDNLPDTNFSCAGKVIGGYYADLETDCQMFHVCTIGQHEEPMDIKFLCLNGTVFDQETRVCERVDEVDCSKSERFYSLNLELYGNTAPPIIKPDAIENSGEDIDEDDYSDAYEEPSTTTVKTTKMTTTTTTTTQRPSPTTTSRPYHTTPKPTYYQTTLHEYQHEAEAEDEDDIYDVIDDNISADVSNHTSSEISKDQYNHYNVDSQVPRPLGNKNQYEETDSQEDLKPTVINDNSQVFSPEEFIYHHNKQNFVHKSPAISFQQHSYTSNGQNSHVAVTTHTGKGNYNNNDLTKTQNTRVQNSPVNKLYLPNNGQSNTKTYVDKSPSYNNYQNYNTQKRVPLVPPPNSQIQAPTGHPGLSTPKHPKQPSYYNFRKPPLTPQGFKPSHLNQPQSPKPNQQIKLNQNFQPSERHEISIEREYEFEKIIPNFPNIPQDYSNNNNYDQKRSKSSDEYESSPLNESRTTSTPYYNTWATRSNNYTKSLPSVIITASASVSDSNGKKLNYSVGNIVHAVKPLIQTNYDDYKESDVALDPFFLDVPKLKKGRNKRSNKSTRNRSKRHYVIKVYKYDPSTADSVITPMSNISTEFDDPLISVTTVTNPPFIHKAEEQSTHWIPPDYVDDNYEPIVYHETIVPIIEDVKSQVSKSSDIPVSTPIVVNKFLSKNTTASNNVDEKYLVNSEHTTDNYVGRTTLDLVKIENTTINVLLNNFTQKAIKRYRLVSINVVNLLENDSDNSKYSCRDKKYHKFYPDKNCRTFHMCSPSENVAQVLNMVFICDIGLYFNVDNCKPSKPNDCESKKL